MKRMYLRLFHGRNSEEETLDGWGFDGPVVGPLDWVHGESGKCLRGAKQSGTGAEDLFNVKFTRSGLVVWGGAFYGAWSVYMTEDGRISDDRSSSCTT